MTRANLLLFLFFIFTRENLSYPIDEHSSTELKKDVSPDSIRPNTGDSSSKDFTPDGTVSINDKVTTPSSTTLSLKAVSLN